MLTEATRRVIRERLAAEVGRIDKSAPWRVALAYPSPYATGMSSLGYQRIYRSLQAMSGVAAERVFLPDGGERPGVSPPSAVSYEGRRPLSDFPLIALSVAYELELVGVLRLLAAADIPVEREQRAERHPLVMLGGPITFANPRPLAPFVDAMVIGDGEGVVELVVGTIRSAASRAVALLELAQCPHVYVPEHHGSAVPPPAQCEARWLPAHSAIRTPHTELADMFLIEAERGCSRACSYCVMRRGRGRTMRLVRREAIVERVPEDVRRVGLVGAAVSDHPDIAAIVRDLATAGREVSLSSLRPDRLDADLLDALHRAGHRTLTTALDGSSERLRQSVGRRMGEGQLVRATEQARARGFSRLKLYLMLGLPGETDADVDECVRLVSELSKLTPVSLGVAPFCAKRHTPLDGCAYAGVQVVSARLARLRRGLRGRADVRATSAKWAWVEHVLAQGAEPEGRAVAEAVAGQGRFADFRAGFGRLGHDPNPG
jgi:radical SAM superfamily enzyme YgiQ (UPF0313 family)